MKQSLYKCYGKINVGLNIDGTTSDGFHNLDMVMIPLVYHDSILISEDKNRHTHSILIDDFSVEIKERNLINGMLDILEKEKGIASKFRIILHKLIPLQGGFGGGSSDAAGTLRCVNDLLKLNLTKDEMKKYSLQLGSDIPFFIDNKPMRCKGRGEVMTPITIKKDYFVIIAQPKTGCSTKVVYAKYDELGGDHPNIDNIIEALANGDDELLANSLANSLQKSATSIVPEIDVLINELKQLNLKIVSMTGSGSGVFALTTDKKLAKNAIKALQEKGYFAELTKFIR